MDEVAVQCPYCWETVWISLESDLEGVLVWDCEVCCRPWSLRIVRPDGRGGAPQVSVSRAS
jgi:hypothetical protein